MMFMVYTPENRSIIRTRSKNIGEILRETSKNINVPRTGNVVEVHIDVNKCEENKDLIEKLRNMCSVKYEDENNIAFKCIQHIETSYDHVANAVEYRGYIALPPGEVKELLSLLLLLHFKYVESTVSNRFHENEAFDLNYIDNTLYPPSIDIIDLVTEYIKIFRSRPEEAINYLREAVDRLYGEVVTLWEKYGDVLKEEYGIDEPPSRTFLEKKLRFIMSTSSKS